MSNQPSPIQVQTSPLGLTPGMAPGVTSSVKSAVQTAVKPILTQPLPPEPAKPTGVGSWFFGKAVRAGTWCMTRSVDTKSHAHLLAPEFYGAIKAFTPRLASHIYVQVTKPLPAGQKPTKGQTDAKWYIEPLYLHDRIAFEKTLEDVLILAAGNLAKHTPTRLGLDGKPVLPTLEDVGFNVFKNVKTQFEHLRTGLGQNPSAAIKQERIQEFWDTLLLLAFEKGKDDLPIRNIPLVVTTIDIREVIWDALRDPEIFNGLYETLTTQTGLIEWISPPQQHSGRCKDLSQTADGAVAVGISRSVSQMVMSNVVPTLLDAATIKDLVDSVKTSMQEQLQDQPLLQVGTAQLQQEGFKWLETMLTRTVSSNSTVVASETMLEIKKIFPQWFQATTEAAQETYQKTLCQHIHRWLMNPSASTVETIVREAFEEAAKAIHPQPVPTPATLKTISTWLSQRLLSIPSQAPYAEKIWGYAAEHLEEAILNIFFPLDGSPAQPVGKVISRCADVALIHVPTIRLKYDALEKLPPSQKAQRDLIEKEIADHFTLFAGDLLLALGLDKNKKLTLLYDTLKVQFADILAKKIYPAMIQPESAYKDTFHKLCWKIYEQGFHLGSQGNAFSQTMADPSQLTHTQQQLLWQTSGAEKIAKDLELFIKGAIAPQVRAATQSYLCSGQVGPTINESLGLGLTPAQTSLLDKELQTTASTNSPATKMAWGYLEKVTEITLPKVFVNLLETLQPTIPGTTPQQNTLVSLPEKMVTQLATWVDSQMKAQPAAAGGAPVPSIADLINKTNALQMKLDAPKQLLNRLRLLKTKLEQRIPVLKAKIQTQLANANSLPSRQAADRIKAINAIATEVKASTDGIAKEVLALQTELTKVQADLGLKEKDYRNELRDIQAEIQTRFCLLAKELLSKMGNDLTKKTHPLYDLPLPATIKQQVWNTLIPDVLTNMMLTHYPKLKPDTTPFKEDLRLIFDGRYVEEMGQALDQFTSAFATHTLATDQTLAKQMFDACLDLVPAGPTSAPVRTLLQSHQSNLLQIFTQNTQNLGKSQDPSIKKLMALVGSSTEPLAVKVIGGLSQCLFEIQASNPDFLAERLTETMVQTANFVEAVNTVTKDLNVSHPYKVPHLVMLQKLQHMQQSNPRKPILHPAFQQHFITDASGTRPMTLEEARFEKFFKPNFERFMKILKLTEKDFPNAQLYQITKDKFGPMLFQSLYEQIIAAPSLRNFQLSFIDNLQSLCEEMERQMLGMHTPATAVDTTDDLSGQGFGKVVKRVMRMVLEMGQWLGQSIITNVNQGPATLVSAPATPAAGVAPTQRQVMTKQSGKILRAFVDAMPGTAANVLIKRVDAVRKMSEEQMGEALYTFIQQRDAVSDIVTPALTSSLKSLHNGQWVGDRFVTPTVKVLPSGQKVNQFQFNFNLSPADILKQKNLAFSTEKLALSRTRTLANQGIDITLVKALNNVREQMWGKIAYQVEHATTTVFHKYARPVQIILKALFALVGGITLLAIYAFALLASPLYWLGTRLHTAIQVHRMDKNFSEKINETIFMSTIDGFLAGMEAEVAKIDRKNALTPAPAVLNLNTELTKTMGEIGMLQTSLSRLALSVNQPIAVAVP